MRDRWRTAKLMTSTAQTSPRPRTGVFEIMRKSSRKSAVRAPLITSTVAAAVALSLATPSAQAASQDADSNSIEDSYIVVYDESVSDPRAETGRREAMLGFTHRHVYRHAVKGF